MKKGIFLGILVFLVLIVFSCFAYAHYDFLSEESNQGIERLKEKYQIENRQNKQNEVITEGFIWGVIAPEHEGYSMVEYTEVIEGEEYTITEIHIINPQGPIRIIWGPGARNDPFDVPKIIVEFIE
ncbi:MAG: hypothetical protein PHG13_00510 [Candidatus Pacebacteria bacterium]|jgi:hypothetical protein|nr:hypothetical protein [Candidatus Paceibacterota bacterium]MDD5721597.1 hypothetical protein [Candidatus Paceibacterota bacterium]